MLPVGYRLGLGGRIGLVFSLARLTHTLWLYLGQMETRFVERENLHHNVVE
jgi:hypothetical protein